MISVDLNGHIRNLLGQGQWLDFDTSDHLAILDGCSGQGDKRVERLSSGSGGHATNFNPTVVNIPLALTFGNWGRWGSMGDGWRGLSGAVTSRTIRTCWAGNVTAWTWMVQATTSFAATPIIIWRFRSRAIRLDLLVVSFRSFSLSRFLGVLMLKITHAFLTKIWLRIVSRIRIAINILLDLIIRLFESDST